MKKLIFGLAVFGGLIGGVATVGATRITSVEVAHPGQITSVSVLTDQYEYVPSGTDGVIGTFHLVK